MVYLLKREKDIVGFELVLKNVPGTLKAIATIPEKYGLNIEFIETCSVAEETYNLFLAIDFTNSNISHEELLEEFKKEEKVVTVNIAPSLYNMIYSSRFCSKNLGGVRAILCGIGTMQDLIEGIREEFGEESGNAFLYHIGYGIGKKIYEIYGGEMKIKNINEAATLLKALANGGAWGDTKEYNIDMEEGKIMVRITELWECEIQKNRRKHSSNLIRGILAGFFKAFLGIELVVKERKCIAAGDSYCEFEINIIG